MPRLAFAPVAVLLLCLTPAIADNANLSIRAGGEPGAAWRLVVAQQAYGAALDSGNTILMLAAIRLARGVSLRAPTAWEKSTTGENVADSLQGRMSAPDPANDHAIAIVQGLAGEDPDLQDLVYDLDAQLPQGRTETAVVALSDLGSGQTDTWRMPLFGEVHAELGVIGDGDSPLSLTVTDEAGIVVCAIPPALAPKLCGFAPVRNGFFSVSVRNVGDLQNSYRLIGN